MPALDRPNIRIGEFRRRVVLQTPSAPTDADHLGVDGDAGVTWSEFANVWCSINPLTGTAVGAPNANLQGVTTYMVKMRYMPGVVNGMRVHEASTGLDLDVLAVLDIIDAHRLLLLECVQRRYPPV